MSNEVEAKIRKLLTLSESGNEHEAASALAFAQKLALKNEIELADLGEVPVEKIDQEVLDDRRGRKITHWRLDLASSLARANGCKIFYNRARISIVGVPRDVARVRLFFVQCCAAVDRLTKEGGLGQGRSYAHSFRHGVVYEIQKEIRLEAQKLREELQGQVSETALVVVDTRRKDSEAWTKENLSLRRVAYSSSVGAGWHEGSAAGKGAYGNATRNRVSGGQRRLS